MKDTVAWECPHCGHQHLWKWDKGDASPGDIFMQCDKCGCCSRTEMIRIGRRVWSALWKDPK